MRLKYILMITLVIGIAGISAIAARHLETKLDTTEEITEEATKVNGKGAAIYKYIDTTTSQYILLTVWTNDYNGSVTIRYPDTLMADKTDSVTENVDEDSTSFRDDISFFNTTGYSFHSYRFYKKDALTDLWQLSADNFEVICDNGKATIQRPN